MEAFHRNRRKRILILTVGILLSLSACTGPTPFLTPGGTDSSGGGNTPDVITGSPRSATGEKTSEEGPPEEAISGAPDTVDPAGLPPPPEQTTMERKGTRADTTQNQPLGGGIRAPDHITPLKTVRAILVGSLSVCRWPGFESNFYHLEGQVYLPLPDASDSWGWSWQAFRGQGRGIVLNTQDGTTAEAPLKTVMDKADGSVTNPFGEITTEAGFVKKEGFFEIDFNAPKEPYPVSIKYRFAPDPGAYEDIPQKTLERDEQGRILLDTYYDLRDKLPKANDIPLCEGAVNMLLNFIKSAPGAKE